jgi:hypothetical protein
MIARLSAEQIFKLRQENFLEYFSFLLDLCYSLALFPDPTIYSDLTKFGISSKVPNWFVSLKSIEEQFEEISKRDIVVLKYHALRTIIFYLCSKIRAEILNESHLILGEGNKSKLIAEIQNIFRRREYGQGRLKTFKNDFDISMDELIQEMDEKLFTDSKKTKKFFLDSFNGKTEKIYIRELIRSFIKPEGMSAPVFASTVSGLLNLLLKDDDKKLLTKDDFWEGDALYGNNYNRYLANRIKKISGLDEQIYSKVDKNRFTTCLQDRQSCSKPKMYAS